MKLSEFGWIARTFAPSLSQPIVLKSSQKPSFFAYRLMIHTQSNRI